MLWLDPSSLTQAQCLLWDAVERLRQVLNEELFLGLFEYEAHLAIYPPGARYRRHLDMSPGAMRRTVTCVIYLNDGWLPEDAGQLNLEPLGLPAAQEEGAKLLPSREIYPVGGTLACFLSQEVWHEVLPSTRPRLSVTGWLCRRD